MIPRTSPCTLKRLGRLAVLMALPFLLASSAFAGTFYSQGSLDPIALASWNSVRAGGGSGPADFASGDVFVVQDTHTMTLSATWTVSGAGSGLQVESGGTLVVPAGQTLAVSCLISNAGSFAIQGTLRFDEGGSFDAGSTASPTYTAGATIAYANSGPVAVGSEWTGSGAVGPGVPSNVSIQGTGAVALPSTDRGIPGSITISSGTLALNATSGALEVGGDWTLSGGATFTPNGRSVKFNGSTDQAVTSGSATFDGVVISKPGGKVTLVDDMGVGGALELTGGNVETGASVLTIGTLGSVVRTSGHVVGRLRKSVASGASSASLEIGDASTYTPVTIAGTGAGFTSAFQLTASTLAGDHAGIAASGLAADRSVNRTYTLAASGYTGGDVRPDLHVCPRGPRRGRGSGALRHSQVREQCVVGLCDRLTHGDEHAGHGTDGVRRPRTG